MKRLFSVLTLVFVLSAFVPTGAYASENTVFDVQGGQYTPVLIHNGMADVASVGAYAQAKGAYAAINATYFDAYETESQVLAKGGDVNPLRAFGNLYGAPLNFPSGVLIDNGRLLHGAGYGSATGQWGGYLGAITKQGTFIVEQVLLNIGFIVDGKAKTAVPSQSKIYIDDKQPDVTVYNIGGNNFFKLRDVMRAIDAGLTYNTETKNIWIDTNIPYAD